MTTRPDPRPDWTTNGLYKGRRAHAAIPGPCTECGRWIYAGDLIQPRGVTSTAIEDDEFGLVVGHRLDLSDVEWIHGDVCPDDTDSDVEGAALVAAYAHGGRDLAAQLQARFDQAQAVAA